VRTDGYVYEGYEIPIYYDPMISKLIVWAQTRNEAIERMKRALYEYKISGVKNTIPFLKRIMEAEDFVSGNYDTHFIEKNPAVLEIPSDCNQECEDMALFIAYLDYTEKMKKLVSEPTEVKNGGSSPWKEFARRKSVLRF